VDTFGLQTQQEHLKTWESETDTDVETATPELGSPVKSPFTRVRTLHDEKIDLFVIMSGGCQVEIGQKHLDTRERIVVDKLVQNQSFGKISELLHQYHDVQIRCLEETKFAVLSAENYHQTLFRIQQQRIAKNLQCLAAMPVFEATPMDVLEGMATRCISRKVKRGELVVTEGANSEDGVYFIKSGSFKVIRKTLAGGKKQPVLVQLNELSAHQMFGEVGVIQNGLRTCSVIANSHNCQVLQLSKLNWKLTVDLTTRRHCRENIQHYPSESLVVDLCRKETNWQAYKQDIQHTVRKDAELPGTKDPLPAFCFNYTARNSPSKSQRPLMQFSFSSDA
jgi:CRP-like cAMP-binding protein